MILLVGYHHSDESRTSCARLHATFCALMSDMLPTVGRTEAACYNALRSMSG